jgi:hypothetical protein
MGAWDLLTRGVRGGQELLAREEELAVAELVGNLTGDVRVLQGAVTCAEGNIGLRDTVGMRSLAEAAVRMVGDWPDSARIVAPQGAHPR